MLAGIPNAPSVYNPRANKELCKSRTQKVLWAMKDVGYITEEQYNKADLSFIDNLQ